MSYRLPNTLPALNRIVRKHSLLFTTERQAAFMLQKLANTRFKFPPKGATCFPVLLQMEKSLSGNAGAGSQAKPSKPATARPQKSAVPVAKAKPRREPRAPRPTLVSANGFDTGLVVFCDGTCEPNPGAGGWGFVAYRDGLEIHSESGGADPSTNNIMELTGALMALRWLYDRKVDEPVRLLCDSQYVVNGCNDWRHGWKAKGWKRGGAKAKDKNTAIANLDLWKELDEALTHAPIKLEWVKGHVGIIGNERADELAEVGRLGALPDEDDALTAIQRQLAPPA